jgi:tRNA1(Val) A37 N6-methylase TrmN6
LLPSCGMAELAMPDATEDALLGGRVRLLQPVKGHRAGTDAVLLAAAVVVRPGERVVDVGAGTGAVGLMVATAMPLADVVLVERDSRLAALCARNAALNGLSPAVMEVDVLDARARRIAGLLPESADLVITNPPFLEEGRARVSPDESRAAAHMLPPGGLEAWLRACSNLVKPQGRLALIHRPDRLGECLSALGRGFGGIALRFVHPAADRPAIRFVLVAIKASRAPLSVAPPLVLHDGQGGFTAEAEALHRGGARLF